MVNASGLVNDPDIAAILNTLVREQGQGHTLPAASLYQWGNSHSAFTDDGGGGGCGGAGVDSVG